MNHWIFQSTCERYDLRERLKKGEPETWYATRYRKIMKPNDIVFFWLAGPPPIRGIYGWGKLTSDPYPKPEWDSWGIDVKYEEQLFDRDKKIDNHISAKKIKSISALEKLLIFKAASATNFLITHKEALAIASLIEPEKRPKLEDV